MSLFREIRRLCLGEKEQIEDILTEIVADVLRNSSELTLEWLGQLEVPDAADAEVVDITTQYRMPGLADHGTDSRIDLVIRLKTAKGHRVVFMESKVGSKENLAVEEDQPENGDPAPPKKQLQVYAELLCEECRQESAAGSLIFITRDFEPVEKAVVKGFDFHFCQTRWFHFYQCLKARTGRDGLENQLKLFMEENNMSLGNKFRSVDLVALENFLGAKALMDETLGEVKPRWQGVLGKGGAVNKAMSQLRMHNRYTIITKLIGFEVLLGYWLPGANSQEPVWVGMTIYCEPKAPDRRALIQAFREWSEAHQPCWIADELDNPRSWAGIYKGEPLNVLQTSDDDVAKVKAHFLALIDELEKFRTQNPQLHWTPTESSNEEDA